MKTLKFSLPLPDLILAGLKDTSWRIDDEKDIQPGDVVSFLYRKDLKEFARVKVIWVKYTTFGDLSSEDKDGHERFSSDEEMYETYSNYYQMPVTSATRVKVIKYKLIKKVKPEE